MRRTLAVVATLSVLVLVVATGWAGAKSHALKPVTFTGTCKTTFVGPTPTSSTLTLSIQGTCNFTHLGHARWLSLQTVDMQAGTITNDSTYTFGKDTLYAHFDGYLTSGPNPVGFAGTETYTGGTGRFDGATGGTSLTGGATTLTQTPLVTGTGWFNVTGSISG